MRQLTGMLIQRQPYKAMVHEQTLHQQAIARVIPQVSITALLLGIAVLGHAEDAVNLNPSAPVSSDHTLNDAIQQAELAKQAANTFITSANAQAGTPLINSSSNNVPVIQGPSDAEAAIANMKEEQQANAELEKAKQEHQQVATEAEAEAEGTTKKPNIFKRIWYYFSPPDEAVVPKISVRVVGAPSVLSKNIEARLEEYTVEAFSDFRASLAELRRMAKEASEAVGYYNAEFRFEQINDHTLRVRVTPHDPVHVKSLDIHYDGDANKDQSFTNIKEEPDLKVGDIMNDQLYEKTKGRIASTATDKGYFDGYWQMHDAKVTLPDNVADIRLNYNSGERYKIGHVEFKNTNPNKKLPLDMDLLEKLVPFKEGDDYAIWKLNNLSRNLSDTRYFNTVQVETVIPDPIVKPLLPLEDGDNSAAPKLDTQQDNKSAINNAVTATAGMVDESQFAGAQKRTETLQQEVSEAEKKAREKQAMAAKVRELKEVPVVVSINADKPNNAEAGIGYGTDTGVRLRTQYRRSLINSRGHNLDANMELSQIRQAFDVRYNMPYKHPLEDTVSIFTGYESEQQGTIGDRLGLSTETLTVGAERAIKPKNGDWQHTFSVRYRLDSLKRRTWSSVEQANLPQPFNITDSKFDQQALLFGYGLNKVYTVGRLDPTKAFRQFYQIDVGSQKLLSDTDLAILRAGWRFIYSLGENDNHQFVGRADAGTIIAKKFVDVPYNLRFFAGGDQSIRGYDYKSLSTLQNGYLIGGQNLAVGSLEYNYQFVPKWRAAVFADAGNAFDRHFNDPVKVGTGVGIRWASPVGPIRVDVAAGVSEAHVPIRLHFFIGPQL